MLFEKTGTGATIEEALEKAKAALNAPEDIDVQYEVLRQPQKKTLGLFGGHPAEVRVYYELPDEEKARTYLKAIIEGMGITNYTVDREENDKDIIYNINCEEDYGILIGRRGETLDAIQYLVRLTAKKSGDEADGARISVNVGNYREKRAENLRALAAKHAKTVLKYGRNVALEPMNPYERRIIHTAIQEIEGVTSHSVGYDSDRKVIISLEEGVKPTHAGSGNYNNRRGGNRGGNRGGRGGYNRGNDRRNSAPAAPTRAPRKDSEGSLYGRIEIRKNSEEE
ncbi:MAG: protein jag [Ruminococcaceae bacterium]|nr:protein jag [Oscillospiraceae bacterium]